MLDRFFRGQVVGSDMRLLPMGGQMILLQWSQGILNKELFCSSHCSATTYNGFDALPNGLRQGTHVSFSAAWSTAQAESSCILLVSTKEVWLRKKSSILPRICIWVSWSAKPQALELMKK